MQPYRVELHDAINFSYENYNYVSQRYPDLKNLAWCSLVNGHFMVLVSMFAFHGTVDSKKEREIICFLKDNRNAIFSDPKFPLKEKLFLLVLCISKPLCKLLIKILKHKSAL